MSDNKTVINITDTYGEGCISDGCNQKQAIERKPLGRVEIYEQDADGKRQLVDKSNLVVYQGREWIAERIFDANNAFTAPETNDWYICWFGIGDGATGPALGPDAPTANDGDLANSVLINAINPEMADSGYKHPYDTTVDFEVDDALAPESIWLVAKVTVTISLDDANGTTLNEAGLYISNSNDPIIASAYKLFSRVTFPAIVKDSSRTLVFVWYIYT